MSIFGIVLRQFRQPSYPLFRSRLVSGAGDIKITKDGNVLMHESVSVRLLVEFYHYKINVIRDFILCLLFRV